MEVVAQILSERPGRSSEKEYAVGDLKDVIEDFNINRKHVTLHPGDYASEWDNSSIEIFIPERVTVTLLPGAIVDYVDDFRVQQYNAFDGDPIEAENASGVRNHPLATGAAERYKYPNFTGHVENITDLNLASEWAFKQDFERSLWTIRNETTGTSFVNVPQKGVVEIRPGEKIETTVDELPGGDEGAFIEIDHETLSTTDDVSNSGQTVLQTLNIDNGHVIDADTIEVPAGVIAGDILNSVQTAQDELEINHDSIAIDGSPINSGPNVVQSVHPYKPNINTPETGHIDQVDSVELIGGQNIRVFDGLNGIEIETDFTVSTSQPSSTDGSNGDIWYVV